MRGGVPVKQSWVPWLARKQQSRSYFKDHLTLWWAHWYNGKSLRFAGMPTMIRASTRTRTQYCLLRFTLAAPDPKPDPTSSSLEHPCGYRLQKTKRRFPFPPYTRPRILSLNIIDGMFYVLGRTTRAPPFPRIQVHRDRGGMARCHKPPVCRQQRGTPAQDIQVLQRSGECARPAPSRPAPSTKVADV